MVRGRRGAVGTPGNGRAARFANSFTDPNPELNMSLNAQHKRDNAPIVFYMESGGYVHGTLAVLHQGERVLSVRQATMLKGALKSKPRKTTRVHKDTKVRAVPVSGRIGVTGLYKVRPGQYVIPAHK